MHRTRQISANSRRSAQFNPETGLIPGAESMTGVQESRQFEEQLEGNKNSASLLDTTGLKDRNTGVLLPNINDFESGETRTPSSATMTMAGKDPLSGALDKTSSVHVHKYTKECEDKASIETSNDCNASPTGYEQWLLDQKNHGYSEEIVAASVLTSLSSVFAAPYRTKNKIGNGEVVGGGGGATDPLANMNKDFADGDIRKETYLRKKQLHTIYKCTWPKCGEIFHDSNTIISHVRSSHLGPKDENDNGFSDGEEEFYFNEIDVDSPQTQRSPPMRRHRSLSDPSPLTQTPVVPNNLRSHSDDNVTRPLRSAVTSHKLKIKRANQVVYQRKTKGDGRKCRKVYGMDNKQLWCTQCRWKKACIKFID